MTNELAKRDDNIVLSKVTRRDVLDEVKYVLQELDETGNIRHARAALTALEQITDTAGLGRAYLLWGMQKWHKARHGEDSETFFSSIEITDPQKVTYAKRLITTWDQISKKAIPVDVQKRSIKELNPIARALADGFVFDDDDWDQIRLAANESEVRTVIRKIKKTKPRADSLTLTMDIKGNLYVRKGDGPREFFGYLDVEKEETFQIVAMAISRVTNNSPILRSE